MLVAEPAQEMRIKQSQSGQWAGRGGWPAGRFELVEGGGESAVGAHQAGVVLEVQKDHDGDGRGYPSFDGRRGGCHGFPGTRQEGGHFGHGC